MIIINENELDNSFLRRKKKSVINKFQPTKSKTIEEANILGVYLFSVGRLPEAYEILKSYAENIPFEEHRWERKIATCQAILFQSYMEKERGNFNESNRLNELVLNNDYYPYIRSDAKEIYFKEIVESLRSTPNLLVSCRVGHNDTCIIYAEIFLNLIYFEQLHYKIDRFCKSDEVLLQKSIKETVESLNNYVAHGIKS